VVLSAGAGFFLPQRPALPGFDRQVRREALTRGSGG
jgi:hypothetical protein